MKLLLWFIGNYEWIFWFFIIAMLIAFYFAGKSIVDALEKEEEDKHNWII